MPRRRILQALPQQTNSTSIEPGTPGLNSDKKGSTNTHEWQFQLNNSYKLFTETAIQVIGVAFFNKVQSEFLHTISQETSQKPEP
jgi:hypothetical protein